MTNKDKFLRDGVSVEEFKTDFCRYLGINGYDTSTVGNVCFALEHFLEHPVKPTLTEDERVILRNIPKDHTRIRRSTYKDKICGKELAPLEIVNEEDRYYNLYILSHLFQFIKERRRIRNKGVTKC